MGRHKIYTPEEYLEAQRKNARESYHRHKEQNAEKFRLRARRDYYRAKVATTEEPTKREVYEKILQDVTNELSELCGSKESNSN